MTSLKSSLRNFIPKKYRTKFGGEKVEVNGGRRKSLSGGKKHESRGIMGGNKSKKGITGGKWGIFDGGSRKRAYDGGSRKRAKTSKRKRRKNSKKSKRRYRRTKRKGG